MMAVQDLVALAAGQPVLAGMAGALLAGSAAWALRTAPAKCGQAVVDLFSVTLVVEARDEMFKHLTLWLSRNAARRSQRLMVQDEYDYDGGRWSWTLTLGRGWHLIWLRGWPMLVNREVSDGGELAKVIGAPPQQRLWIMSPGRSQARIRRLIGEAEAIFNGDGMVKVYTWAGGGYAFADRRAPRHLDTVFLPPAQKARVLADLRAFLDARGTYAARGTPWRRGYLLEGPPGTGKTSLVFALAAALGRAVYVINLAAVASDNDLLSAFNAVGADGVVVIEDIDAVHLSRERGDVAETVNPGGVPVPGERRASSLTLSGLLNAIDGIAAREGRLLFATSNHAGKLDAALVRPGRIDRREVIAPLERAEAWTMFRAFRPEGSSGAFERLVAGALPIAAAELQNLLQSDESAHAVRVRLAHG